MNYLINLRFKKLPIMNILKLQILFIFISFAPHLSSASLEEGIYEKMITLTSDAEIVAFQRSALKDSSIEIKFNCDDGLNFDVEIAVRSSPCYREFYQVLGSSTNGSENLEFYFSENSYVVKGFDYDTFWYYKSKRIAVSCQGHYVHVPYIYDENLARVSNAKVWEPSSSSAKRKKREIRSRIVRSSTKNASVDDQQQLSLKTNHPAIILNEDGMYIVMIKIIAKSKEKTDIGVHIEWKHSRGYLSPIDWPLLPFYGVSCGIYAIYGVAWLIISFLQWRDILRIQFWIGAVIVLGMIEKAVFYFEYQTMNNAGREVEGAMEVAEIISCMKKTLSFVLVLFVSVGFGVVKPRLGATLHKVIVVGFIYFILCAVEAVSRVSKVQHDSPRQKQLVALPLHVMQLVMFYWIFTALSDTIRALRLRRNEIKLSLYRHFTNTLIFCVVASAAFMIWSLVVHQFNTCLKDFKHIWLEIAIWHILFSVLLLVIMILWRPTNNNQRYAFTPLLDNAEDEVEEDTIYDEGMVSADAMKFRAGGSSSTTKASNRKSRGDRESLEDELKWVEQHIPSSLADRALPALNDSDDEIQKTKMEISKMQ